jgi:hypothetical protein
MEVVIEEFVLGDVTLSSSGPRNPPVVCHLLRGFLDDFLERRGERETRSIDLLKLHMF